MAVVFLFVCLFNLVAVLSLPSIAFDNNVNLLSINSKFKTCNSVFPYRKNIGPVSGPKAHFTDC